MRSDTSSPERVFNVGFDNPPKELTLTQLRHLFRKMLAQQASKRD